MSTLDNVEDRGRTNDFKKIYVLGIEMWEAERDGRTYRAYSEAGLRKIFERLDGARSLKRKVKEYTLDYTLVKAQGKRLDIENAKKVGKDKRV